MDPWKIWHEKLGSPKFVLAPMVDHSELPWRMLSREFGCQLTYSPMFHAANFASQKKYRLKYLQTCPKDRPLIIQFCANNADTLIAAAKQVEDRCDGIDINLGCPQEIARRGHYGAFLQDELELIREMVEKLRSSLDPNLSISCKIRRLDNIDKTVQYAKLLEEAGCSFIGIHARTREQRGCKTGLADWAHIRAVKESVKIPVIANGNIQSRTDAENCFSSTNADAVMIAEGNLYNPAILSNIHPPAWVVGEKYLEYVKKYPIPAGMAKSHLFKLFHRCVAMDENADLRAKLGQSTTLEQLYEVVDGFKKRYISKEIDCDQTVPITVQPVPPYLCQPRFRYNQPAETERSASEKDVKVKDKLMEVESQNCKRIKVQN